MYLQYKHKEYRSENDITVFSAFDTKRAAYVSYTIGHILYKFGYSIQ